MRTSSASPPPPGIWLPGHRAVRSLVAPIERFLAIEAASGILLLGAAALALVLANSPLAAAYESFWTTTLGLQLGSLSFARDLRWWVNDGLMTIFFFVVGLEIRREIHRGELSELRRAALPLAAALGGMLVPALIYALLNAGRPTSVGWGVPMATDIAFAVGVLALLGDRVAPALRVLLLSLAVIDDVGAIIVIAAFYSEGIQPAALAVGGAGLASILGLQALGVRAPLMYLPSALVAWAGVYAAGIHPTVAGVMVGLLTPARAWLGPDEFAVAAENVAGEARALPGASGDGLAHHLRELAGISREAVAPLDRLVHALHPSVAFLIMPLFALANAGVAFGSADLSGDGWRVFVGIFLGLLVGKFVGILAATRLSVAIGVAAAPRGVGWPQVSVVGMVAGIGFTMALFVGQLAFPPGPELETAKLAILAASACAGVLGYALGRVVLKVNLDPGAAQTASEAESSTEG
jgi:NhaA family Na+:H+ antiporter